MGSFGKGFSTRNAKLGQECWGHMQRSKKEKRLYFISKFIMAFGWLGFIIAAIVKIYFGQGLDYYYSVEGAERGLKSSLADLIILAIVMIVLIVGWTMRHYSRKHGRSGKEI